MGFRIDSLSNMSNIAANVSSAASSAQNKITTTQQTLSDMTGIVSGNGIEDTLAKLSGAISVNGNDAVTLLNDISTFITMQVGNYTTNEEDVNAALTNVNSALEGLEV